ncbi:unnamed protein product [Prunus armeniaca]|uniref:Helicase associated domain-containing protein n=1 Tax=Prunus armeniaca TaxID=36596 RepID=A0A6J5XEA5_PRUAR|nr:unnamed protein product [Prunus armeniaca]CAB4312286.1 unnamed protein product [Prunus armeniaca]
MDFKGFSTSRRRRAGRVQPGALQPPDPLAVQNAIELLKTTGALDNIEELTPLGMSPSLHTTIGSKHWEDASNGFYLSMPESCLNNCSCPCSS